MGGASTGNGGCNGTGGPVVQLEVLVEPFKENDPGPHVISVVQALADADLRPDMGPFATTASGELDVVVMAVQDMLKLGFGAGATAISLRIAIAP